MPIEGYVNMTVNPRPVMRETKKRKYGKVWQEVSSVTIILHEWLQV